MKNLYIYIYIFLMIIIFLLLILLPDLKDTVVIALAALLFILTSILSYKNRNAIFRKRNSK